MDLAQQELALADNARLRARVAELESRLGKNSTNSSMPPSRDDAQARAERAKRATQRPKSKRKPGGQPGRRGHTMRRVEADLQIVGGELHVRINALSAPRRSRAIAGLCADLNATDTVYPGTDLVLRYSVKLLP